MKQQLTVLSLTVLLCATTYAQKKDEVNYSDAFQVDSSDYFLIPKLVDNDNKADYGKGKGYLPWNNYSDVYFYNTATNTSKKLFGDQLVLIAPFTSSNHSYRETPVEIPPNILTNHIVYLARTENFNGDNALDTDDPLYLYISDKKGENLRQLSPKGMNVLSWMVSKDKKVLLIKLQIDKNGNKKFGEGDDQVYYRVDLTNDISAMKAYQVTL